jgi:hypothetical protein
VALTVLEKKIFKDLASFNGFLLPVRKNIQNFGTMQTNLKEAK